MYVTTLFNGVVALDPETVPKDGASTRRSVCGAAIPEGLINCGVVLSTDPGEEEGDACHSLIVRATIGARLFALDAATGGPVPISALAGRST
ncbi:MAG: hypothetical protein J2P48_12685 [Alphaproteobacteria bacterium]|nr:hypothetical protein [Alphaproteobacteria bacterium]